ncbi:MAG: ABC transporter substrate-binding protein [Methylovirgula sp.]|uniref:ABC transporter substrate-binding protein n=1 Tax=Methylovirgula sp. TaxID=1978224 RepID=UPI0030760AE3
MIERRLVLKQGAAAVASIGLAMPTWGRWASAQSALVPTQGVYSAPGITYSGLYIADAEKLWAKNGLEAKVQRVQGGPLAMAALTNKDAQFCGIASSDPVIGWGKGIETLTVAAFTGRLAMQFTARNDWLARQGVSPSSPLSEKLKAFKGARLGASTIGGGPAQYARYLIRQGGVDPNTDVKILAVGFGPSRVAALRTNQVDITVGDAPEADQVELDGFGHLFINCSQDVPIYSEFPYTILSVSPEFADKRPDVVRRIAHTIGQANNYYHANFGKVVDVMRGVYKSVDPRAIERALERDKSSFPPGGRMTEAMWVNMNKVATDLKMITAPLPTREGTFWTNKFTV